jgi:transposase
MTAKMQTPTVVPDPESRPRPKRRTYTRKYKLQLLKETEQAPKGGVGAILRREGLYSGSLTAWRKEREAGSLGALASKKRGPKANPERAELEQLRRKLARTEKRLEVAEHVIAAQKKLCGLLGLPSATEEDESSS